jgi:hypothetical protein
MSHQIRFQAGQNQTFVATRSFALGSSGITVPEGAEVIFDGTAVSYAGLAPIVMPQLRGAIRQGWVVPQDQYDPNTPAQRPVAAGMTVRAADGGNPMNPDHQRTVVTTVDEEEREVGNVSAHAAMTREQNRDNYRRRRTPRAESTAGQRYEGGAVEPQDGVEVPGVSFQTLAGEASKRVGTDMTKAGSAISAANKVKIRPGQGRTREELIRDAIDRGGLTAEELQEYQEELAAAIAARGGDPETVNKIVGRVAAPGTRHTEGFTVAGSVGGGTEIADLGGTGGQGEMQVIEEEGIKFTTTAGPKKGVRLVDKQPSPQAQSPVDDAVCRTIARAVCPDFPENYVFTDPIRKKIARLQADYDDRPDVIRAVAAAETDGEVKRRLVQEFPEAF